MTTSPCHSSVQQEERECVFLLLPSTLFFASHMHTHVQVTVEDYAWLIGALQPDLYSSLADIVTSHTGPKRQKKAGKKWLHGIVRRKVYVDLVRLIVFYFSRKVSYLVRCFAGSARSG